MEMERVPAAGYKIVGLPVVGFQRAFAEDVDFFWVGAKRTERQAKWLLNLSPMLLMVLSGFMSSPILKAAVRKGVPAVLQEQNSYARWPTKLLAAKVKRSSRPSEYGARRLIKLFPPEIHPEKPFETIADKTEAFKYFNLNPDKAGHCWLVEV